MYLRNSWEVLVVDDEPDVHAVTNLVLQGIEVYGLPLNVRRANSGTEAKRDLMEWARGERPSDLSVAFIDVVMESDTAGLDLCRYIREEMRNDVTRLIVRTGQAGKAPERVVTDRYDITTYITKVEATEDRLYTLVKSGVRESFYDRVATGTTMSIDRTIAAFAERHQKKTFLEELPKVLQQPMVSPEGKQFSDVECHAAFIIDGQVYGAGEYSDRALALSKFDTLKGHPATGTGPRGEELRQYGSDVLLSLKDGSVNVVAKVNYRPMPYFNAKFFWTWMSVVRRLVTIAA
jgi:CheY-like chemotaxis protein